MNAHLIPHIVIAVIVTDREPELCRLLDSLKPVEHDPHLHVFVLDNGASQPCKPPHMTAQQLIAACALRSAGRRAVVKGSTPHQPLHLARVELTTRLAEWIDATCPEPIIWMVDDDLTFETLEHQDGKLHVYNTAEVSLRQARQCFVQHADVSIVVGQFSGDPPIRPDAVLAGQFTDLVAALQLARSFDPRKPWPAVLNANRSQDDYYDHAERFDMVAHMSPRQWVPRAWASDDYATQLTLMLSAASSISRGSTPFRPLLATREPMMTVERVKRANRGGNTLFRALSIAARHPYPAIQLGRLYSRRADMIGLTLLAREAPFGIAVSRISLRHDRSQQSSFSSAAEQWLPEFAGVLLSRAVDAWVEGALPSREQLRVMAFERASRILDALSRARTAADQASEMLSQTDASWWREAESRQAADVLTHTLNHSTRHIGELLDGRLHAVLTDAHVVGLVHDGLERIVAGGLP